MFEKGQNGNQQIQDELTPDLDFVFLKYGGAFPEPVFCLADIHSSPSIRTMPACGPGQDISDYVFFCTMPLNRSQ